MRKNRGQNKGKKDLPRKFFTLSQNTEDKGKKMSN